ncbi:sigma-54-dependent Fis family transcriptional regulator, partial [bacterium]|nr:sigma-54-dependent Fis family transcriptional regulator [bacterium]
RLIVTHDGNEIHSEHLPSSFYQSTQIVKELPKNNEELKKVKKIVKEKLYGEIERSFLTEALKRNNWNITKAAKEVGIQRSNFQAMMKKNKISTKQYK